MRVEIVNCNFNNLAEHTSRNSKLLIDYWLIDTSCNKNMVYSQYNRPSTNKKRISGVYRFAKNKATIKIVTIAGEEYVFSIKPGVWVYA